MWISIIHSFGDTHAVMLSLPLFLYKHLVVGMVVSRFEILMSGMKKKDMKSVYGGD